MRNVHLDVVSNETFYCQMSSGSCLQTQNRLLEFWHFPPPIFLSSQRWSKKENVRSKGLESGKRCTRAWISQVVSGVENGQVVPPFAECCASTSFYVASWLAALRAFRSHVLLFLLHRRERRTMCNSFAIKNRRCCARTL